MDDFGMVDDENERHEQSQAERQPVPAGVHEFKIVRVTNQDYGFDLGLAVDDRQFGWVWHRLDKSREQSGYRVRELRTALGISLEQWRSSDPTELVDRRVRAEIRHKVGDDGRLFVNVWKYLPVEQVERESAPQLAAKPARTPAAKVKAASPAIGSDDIPF